MAKKKAPAAKAPTKTEIMNNIAEETGLAKKDVIAVFEALNTEIGKAVSKKGPGVFTIPGLCKIVIKDKPATPAKKNQPDPFNPGQFRDIAAKPASRQVKVRPLKALKDMAQ